MTVRLCSLRLYFTVYVMLVSRIIYVRYMKDCNPLQFLNHVPGHELDKILCCPPTWILVLNHAFYLLLLLLIVILLIIIISNFLLFQSSSIRALPASLLSFCSKNPSAIWIYLNSWFGLDSKEMRLLPIPGTGMRYSAP